MSGVRLHKRGDGSQLEERGELQEYVKESKVTKPYKG